MAIARPTSYPDLGYDPTTDTLTTYMAAPSTAAKAAGYGATTTYYPPAKWENYLRGYSAQWVRFFDQLTAGFMRYYQRGFNTYREKSASAGVFFIGQGCVASQVHNDVSIWNAATRMEKQLINSGKTALVAWAEGSGSTYGSAATSATIAAGWFYVFAVFKPTTAAVDYVVDDNLAGSHVLTTVSASGYTEFRHIGYILISGTSGAFIVEPFVFSGGMYQLLSAFITPADHADAGAITNKGYGASGSVTVLADIALPSSMQISSLTGMSALRARIQTKLVPETGHLGPGNTVAIAPVDAADALHGTDGLGVTPVTGAASVGTLEVPISDDNQFQFYVDILSSDASNQMKITMACNEFIDTTRLGACPG
jgi:hypothetical protein